jgi:hypothetical protein
MTEMIRLNDEEWEKVVHDKRRHAVPWVRLYQSVLDSPGLHKLTDAQARVALSLYVRCAVDERGILWEPRWCRDLIHSHLLPRKDFLITSGFFVFYADTKQGEEGVSCAQDASAPLTECEDRAEHSILYASQSKEEEDARARESGARFPSPCDSEKAKAKTWEAFIGEIRMHVDHDEFERWFSQMKNAGIGSGGNVTITFTTSSAREYLFSNHGELIDKAWEIANKGIGEVQWHKPLGGGARRL